MPGQGVRCPCDGSDQAVRPRAHEAQRRAGRMYARVYDTHRLIQPGHARQMLTLTLAATTRGLHHSFARQEDGVRGDLRGGAAGPFPFRGPDAGVPRKSSACLTRQNWLMENDGVSCSEISPSSQQQQQQQGQQSIAGDASQVACNASKCLGRCERESVLHGLQDTYHP